MVARHRILLIEHSRGSDTKLDKFKMLLDKPANIKKFAERNLKVVYRQVYRGFNIVLIGYDRLEKYSTIKVSQAELNRIYAMIDDMPMGIVEAKRRKTSRKVSKIKSTSRKKSRKSSSSKKRSRQKSRRSRQKSFPSPSSARSNF